MLLDGATQCVKMHIKKLDAHFLGTGDLFSALWTAWSHRHPDDLVLVANKVQSTMQHVLSRTLTAAQSRSSFSQLLWSHNQCRVPEMICGR